MLHMHGKKIEGFVPCRMDYVTRANAPRPVQMTSAAVCSAVIASRRGKQSVKAGSSVNDWLLSILSPPFRKCLTPKLVANTLHHVSRAVPELGNGA